jgi:lipoyl(octanoyl) transferase
VVRPFHPIWLGTVHYAEALALQRALHAARVADEIDDVLLLLEHPPTITHSHTGRGSENLVASAEQLAARGVRVEPTDRGGNITFHGPGQLVGYPIIKLEDHDLHRYLRRVEEVLIGTARAFGVQTGRVQGRTGTWLLDSEGAGVAKLAAIGVKASRWTTLHGFAINVRTDLSFFELIVPCGIADAGVTSLERIAGERGEAAPTVSEVAGAAVGCFADVFEREQSPVSEPLVMLCRSHGAVPRDLQG